VDDGRTTVGDGQLAVAVLIQLRCNGAWATAAAIIADRRPATSYPGRSAVGVAAGSGAALPDITAALPLGKRHLGQVVWGVCASGL